MAYTCVIKDWNEMTRDDVYENMRARIEGFIVNNQTCYQDAEPEYDKHGKYIFIWDYDRLIATWQMCTSKTIEGRDRSYHYPCLRRQVWLEKSPSLEYSIEVARVAARQINGNGAFMFEALDWELCQKILDRYTAEVVNQYTDKHGRLNYAMVVAGK